MANKTLIEIQTLYLLENKMNKKKQTVGRRLNDD